MTEDTFAQKFLKLIPIIAIFMAVIITVAVMVWAGQTFGLGHMLTEPFFSGIFNYPILFGIQVYFWLFLVWILAIAGSEIFWRFTMWEPMTPFHGLFKAFTDGTKAALVADINLDWALLSESGGTITLPKEYYDFVTDQMGWWIKFRAWLYKPDFSAAIAEQLEGRKDDPTLITIGKIATHIIIDMEWWTDKRSPQRKAIVTAIEKYNKENPEDQIHRFITFIKYVKEGKILKPEGVIMERTIPWARIDAAFPIIRSDAAWAGFVRQIAEDMAGEDSANLTRWAGYVLIFGAGLIILMFVSSWVFPHHAAAAAAEVATKVTPIMTPPGL
jgi:hypothetical protein